MMPFAPTYNSSSNIPLQLFFWTEYQSFGSNVFKAELFSLR